MLTSSATRTPQSNYHIILDALASYADQTGTDISTDPFADKLQHSNSPDAILELLQDREKTFKEYRDGNRNIINSLKPAVQVLHAFSGILGESLSLVSSTALVPLNRFIPFSRSHSHQQKQSSLVLMFFSPCVCSCHQPDPSDVQYARLRLASVRAMTLSLTSSSASEIFFSVLLSMPGFHPATR
jgi:fungal STAND N-terminal Goodbye domain